MEVSVRQYQCRVLVPGQIIKRILHHYYIIKHSQLIRRRSAEARIPRKAPETYSFGRQNWLTRLAPPGLACLSGQSTRHRSRIGVGSTPEHVVVLVLQVLENIRLWRHFLHAARCAVKTRTISIRAARAKQVLVTSQNNHLLQRSRLQRLQSSTLIRKPRQKEFHGARYASALWMLTDIFFAFCTRAAFPWNCKK